MHTCSDAGIVPDCHGDTGAEAEFHPHKSSSTLVGTERMKSQIQAVAFQQTCDTLPTFDDVKF